MTWYIFSCTTVFLEINNCSTILFFSISSLALCQNRKTLGTDKCIKWFIGFLYVYVLFCFSSLHSLYIPKIPIHTECSLSQLYSLCWALSRPFWPTDAFPSLLESFPAWFFFDHFLPFDNFSVLCFCKSYELDAGPLENILYLIFSYLSFYLFNLYFGWFFNFSFQLMGF